ncbi:hypothetical protein CA267_003800 [Alteromonas pelagimontana]|uniref:Uncharacterized protein n=1 Tax=Alteromonas pelagimontana TaxID=1858656 RepID=A0A6M4MBQ2_9ALTE|nr:hypothetical protein [Alteromonas pelagimontana]QJR79965.1 hypothetical protein CA267_003800 [Alteromonas pelagimontana]
MKKTLIISTMWFGVVANTHAEETSIVDMADKNEIRTCRSQIKSVSDFIIKDKAHSTHASWNSKDSDNRLYATLTSKGYSDGDSHVSVITAPTSSGKCDSTYVETFALPQSCMVTREETYKDWKYIGTMNGKTLLLESDGGAVNIYLSPQGESICLVSRREVVYQ